MATGRILGALAAASCCCILPLVLVGISEYTTCNSIFIQLAPYQLCFIVGTFGFLGNGCWLVYRSSKAVCADGSACACPLSNNIASPGLIAATVLVVGALDCVVTPAANAPAFLISRTELADKLNDRMRRKNLSHRAAEIDCAVTDAAEKCRYDIGGVVVVTTVAPVPGGPIWSIVAADLAGADTGSKQGLAAIAIYTVLMEVLSPRSNVKDRSIALGNLISGLSNLKRDTDLELDGVRYTMTAASDAEVWLIASPIR